MKKIVILYKELAGYFVNCANFLVESQNVELDVVAYPINPEAPFKFSFHSKITLHDRTKYGAKELEQLILSKDPDLIYCGGWSDKEYLSVVKKNKGKMALLGFDNQWEGTLKQQLATKYAKLFFEPIFNFAFVPGAPQVNFAKRMGFEPERIKQGAYCCELEKFTQMGERHEREKRKSFPKRLLYVGRYIQVKGIFDLFDAFQELAETDFPDWELHCLGTGDLWDQKPQHAQIVHHGFVQPDDFEQHISNTSIFVLPSHFEPWGVVVHEMAAAGYPMVVSDKVGAATTFLKDGKNGWSYHGGNKEQLKAALREAMSLDQTTYNTLAEESKRLSLEITPEKWANTMMEMCG